RGQPHGLRSWRVPAAEVERLTAGAAGDGAQLDPEQALLAMLLTAEPGELRRLARWRLEVAGLIEIEGTTRSRRRPPATHSRDGGPRSRRRRPGTASGRRSLPS